MKLIVANWKMNHHFDEADAWLDDFFKSFSRHYESFKNLEIVLCPPSLLLDYIDNELMEDGIQYLEEVMKHDGKNMDDFSPEELTEIVIKQRPLKLGAQDCHYESSGSFTGDISASMLTKVGCQYVILGHSERRTGHGESNEIVAKKVRAALNEELIPIICVGESKEVRDRAKHLEFIYMQIMTSVPQDVKFKQLIIAYEPIWSIGTGITPTLAQIEEMAKLIRKIFHEKLPNLAQEFLILYGGSVTSKNSAEIMATPEINGLLVGKASLDEAEFSKICLSAF